MTLRPRAAGAGRERAYRVRRAGLGEAVLQSYAVTIEPALDGSLRLVGRATLMPPNFILLRNDGERLPVTIAASVLDNDWLIRAAWTAVVKGGRK